jgi:hypothetical protein
MGPGAGDQSSVNQRRQSWNGEVECRSTAVILKQTGKMTYGALWSFSGNTQRADVNQMFLQPFFAYQATRTPSALGTEDRFVTSSIPVGVAKAGEEARTVYSPTASRLSTELRMPSQRGQCDCSSKATSPAPAGP